MQNGFDAFIERNGGSDQSKEIIEWKKPEIVLYEKHRDYYSYGVYVVKKV